MHERTKQYLLETFAFVKEDLNLVSYVILLNGKMVSLVSGKYIWRSKNAASCALTHHIHSHMHCCLEIREANKASNYNAVRKLNDIITKELKKEFAIVSLDEYMEKLNDTKPRGGI